MPLSPRIMSRLGQRLVSPEMKARLKHFHFHDAGHGFDVFGLSPSFIEFGVGLTRWPYDSWFRVKSQGHENIPDVGAAILASNHSGNLPFDGAMLWADVVRHTNPPRVVRGIADHFVPALPFVGTLFARAGMVGGSRGNVRALLETGELLMIFPEGTPGIIKPFSERYQLRPFRLGHAELAIRNGAPIIPVGIVGAEEQMPALFSSKTLGSVLGLEALPIPITPLPLPVKYHIYYGPPIAVQDRYPSSAADDPEVLTQVASEVQSAVQSLLEKGLQERKGVFR